MTEKFITVYQITRHLGGAEEGGWWYNWYEPIETIHIPRRWAKKPNRYWDKINTLKNQMQRKHADRAWGNIYSANDGILVKTYIEETCRENESTECPHYE